MPMTPMVSGGHAGEPRELPGPIETGALLVIDVQRGFGDPAFMSDSVGASDRAEIEAAVDRMIELVDHARRTGLKVIWVTGGAADRLPPWRSLFWLKGKGDDPEFEGFKITEEGKASGEFYRVKPNPGELHVKKGRYSAFEGSDIEEVLRREGVDWVITSGLTTECCVGSTSWDAVQRGFRVIVAGDAAACQEKSMHDAALRIMAHNVGLIVSVDELGTALTEQAAAAAVA